MKKYSSISIFLFLFWSSAMAQIEVNQVEVVKQFEAEIEEAEKIALQPVVVVPKSEKKKYKYDVTIQPLALNYPDPQIKPLSMKRDEPLESDQFYLKGGYGNLNNPLLKFRWATHGDDKYEINTHIDYAFIRLKTLLNPAIVQITL